MTSYVLGRSWQQQRSAYGISFTTFDKVNKRCDVVSIGNDGDYGMSTSEGWVGDKFTITDTSDAKAS